MFDVIQCEDTVCFNYMIEHYNLKTLCSNIENSQIFTNAHRQHKSDIPFLIYRGIGFFYTSYYHALKQPKLLIKNTANGKNPGLSLCWWS